MPNGTEERRRHFVLEGITEGEPRRWRIESQPPSQRIAEMIPARHNQG